MRRTRSVTGVDGTRRLNCPVSLVYVPVVVPTTVTDADVRAAPPSCAVTRPEIRRCCCAPALIAVSKPKTMNNKFRIFTAPPKMGD